MRRPAALTAVLAAGLLAWSASAAAQSDAEPEPEPPAQTPAAHPANPSVPPNNRDIAVIHYERGRSLYSVGRYREAVFELETAYSLDPSGTNLLLNLGTVHERLGHIDAAILAYERHLASATDPAERGRTQRILTRLRGARPELADIARRHGRADGLFWATAGVAFACTGIGIAMFATQRPGAHDDTPPIAVTVTGATLGVLALVLYFAREAPERHTLFVNASLTPGAGSLGVAGTF